MARDVVRMRSRSIIAQRSEHMLFKTYMGDDRRNWDGRMGQLDATYNGMTDDEVVRYFVTLPSEKVEGGMRALAELVRDPRWIALAGRVPRVQLVHDALPDRHFDDIDLTI